LQEFRIVLREEEPEIESALSRAGISCDFYLYIPVMTLFTYGNIRKEIAAEIMGVFLKKGYKVIIPVLIACHKQMKVNIINKNQPDELLQYLSQDFFQGFNTAFLQNL
jgi:hypothetical protein